MIWAFLLHSSLLLWYIVHEWILTRQSYSLITFLKKVYYSGLYNENVRWHFAMPFKYENNRKEPNKVKNIRIKKPRTSNNYFGDCVTKRYTFFFFSPTINFPRFIDLPFISYCENAFTNRSREMSRIYQRRGRLKRWKKK